MWILVEDSYLIENAELQSKHASARSFSAEFEGIVLRQIVQIVIEFEWCEVLQSSSRFMITPAQSAPYPHSLFGLHG